MANIDREFDEAIRYNKPIKPEQARQHNKEFDDSFLEIFNTPEYKQRQAEARRRDEEAYNQSHQSTSQSRTTVSNVNTSRLSRKDKLVLKRGGLVVAAIIVLGILVKIIVPGQTSEQTPSGIVPDGYVSMYTSEEVVRGDTVYSIANEYYNANIYSGTYGSLNDYVETIIDTNNLSYDGDIEPYDVLSIPVLVDADNIHYQELCRIEQEINRVREAEYWIDYVVKPGDSLSSIAAKASGSTGETIELTKRIMTKNDLRSSLIYEGQHLKIVNPILGQLKIQFNDTKEALQESLKDSGSMTR